MTAFRMMINGFMCGVINAGVRNQSYQYLCKADQAARLIMLSAWYATPTYMLDVPTISRTPC